MADQRGVYTKYIVKRTDKRDGPGDKHEWCEYFVLDTSHDPHALPALFAYAQSCQHDNPELAREIYAIAAARQGRK